MMNPLLRIKRLMTHHLGKTEAKAEATTKAAISQ